MGRLTAVPDWPGTTAEQVRENGEDPFFTYFGNKVVAEKAAWDYVKEHPSLDLTTSEYQKSESLFLR